MPPESKLRGAAKKTMERWANTIDPAFRRLDAMFERFDHDTNIADNQRNSADTTTNDTTTLPNGVVSTEQVNRRSNMTMTARRLRMPDGQFCHTFEQIVDDGKQNSEFHTESRFACETDVMTTIPPSCLTTTPPTCPTAITASTDSQSATKDIGGIEVHVDVVKRTDFCSQTTKQNLKKTEWTHETELAEAQLKKSTFAAQQTTSYTEQTTSDKRGLQNGIKVYVDVISRSDAERVNPMRI